MFIFSYYILITVGKAGVLITPHDYWLKTFLDLIYPFGDFISLTLSVIISGLYFNFLMKKYRFGIVIVLVGLIGIFFQIFFFRIQQQDKRISMEILPTFFLRLVCFY